LYQRLKENNSCSFLFLDEFDAFYHHSLSKAIIERLKEVSNTQVILTTHNTSIISNDLLRPDCYFLMYEDGIKSLSNSTAKELREAHNIEKMYRAGSFEK
jgi:AAA15 family ATPase/GTPase